VLKWRSKHKSIYKYHLPITDYYASVEKGALVNIKEKYKQALRGLFTSGTSPSFKRKAKKENSGKGRQQTGIESELLTSKDTL